MVNAIKNIKTPNKDSKFLKTRFAEIDILDYCGNYSKIIIRNIQTQKSKVIVIYKDDIKES